MARREHKGGGIGSNQWGQKGVPKQSSKEAENEAAKNSAISTAVTKGVHGLATDLSASVRTQGAGPFGDNATIALIKEERRNLEWGVGGDKTELAKIKRSPGYIVGSKEKRRKAESLEERIGVAEARLRDVKAELEFEIEMSKKASALVKGGAPDASSERAEAPQSLSLQGQLESVAEERKHRQDEEIRTAVLGRAEMFAERISGINEDVSKHAGVAFGISDVDVQMDPNSLSGKRLEGVTSRSRFSPREGSLLRASLNGKVTLGSGDDAITVDVKVTYDGDYSDRHSPDAWRKPADYGEIRPIRDPIEYRYEGKQISDVDELLQLTKSKKK